VNETLEHLREDGGALGVVEVAAETSAPTLSPVADADALLVRLQLAERRARLAESVASPIVPPAVATRIRAQWAPDAPHVLAVYADPDAYARAVEGAIADDLRLYDAAAETGAKAPAAGVRSPVVGMGAPRVQATSPVDHQRAAVQVGLDRLFGVREWASGADWDLLSRSGHRPFEWRGIREAYAQITGDWGVSGRVNAEASAVREANEVTTSILNQVVLNSMTKRLVQDYQAQPQEWRKFCSITTLRDMKSQDRVRLNDFSSLPTVTEGSAYVNLAWDDARETYTPVKKGSLVQVTREAILNDDIYAISRIPSKLGIAAAVTINEFVYGLITSNPTMTDTTKVFDDGVQTSHANRLTSSLSATAVQSGMTLMLKQTNAASKRIGARPRFLLVPPDLLFTAMTLVSSTLLPGSMNNDINVLQGAMEVISVPQFTDVTDWYLIADPMIVPGIEVGFLNGRDTPEMLMQEGGDGQYVFTNDLISYKVRWEFGGGWVDYRGAVWSQVAG
jgi:hypothetical protein